MGSGLAGSGDQVTDGVEGTMRFDLSAGGGVNGADFGIEGIASLATAHRGLNMERLVSELFAAVTAHTGGAPAHDDRTVLAASRISA